MGFFRKGRYQKWSHGLVKHLLNLLESKKGQWISALSLAVQSHGFIPPEAAARRQSNNLVIGAAKVVIENLRQPKNKGYIESRGTGLEKEYRLVDDIPLSSRAKVSDSQVLEIFHSQDSPQVIAERYGISDSLVYGIKRRTHRKEVTRSENRTKRSEEK